MSKRFPAFGKTLLTVLLLVPLLSQANMRLLDRIVAVVNDGAIMASELDERVAVIAGQFQERGQPLPPPQVLRRQLIERMIVEKIQLQMAERAGIRVDDNSLNQALAGIARQNGLTLEQFARVVQEDGHDWLLFREQIREDMVVSRLQQRMVASRVRITDREIDRFLNSEAGQSLFESELRLGHILVRLPSEATPEQIQQAEAKINDLITQLEQGADFASLAANHSDAPEALDGGDLGWRAPAQLPTLFSQAATSLAVGQLSEPLRSGAGFHLLKLQDRRGDAETVVTQHRVRHVLIRNDALTSPEQALQRAERIRLRVADGELSFADAARQFSDDPGSARNGGELGWVAEGEMVPEFEEMMLATPQNTLSPVFLSQFGAHFLRVEEQRDADMTQEFIRMQARQALQQRRFEEELENWLQEQRAEAYVDLRL